MAKILEKGSMFPEELTNEVFNLVRGKSSLARLAEARPIPFRGAQVWTFNMDKEVDLVAESGAKSNGGATMAPVNVTPVKVEYGVRVSDEFLYATEDEQIDVLRAFGEGWANKMARGLDIMAFHGFNPRTAAAAPIIAANNFDAVLAGTGSAGKVTQSNNADTDAQAAIALVEAAEHEVTGMAIAPAFRTALAQLKKGSTSNEALYPELAWGAAPSTINGLPVDVNGTVSFGTYASATPLAYVGNFRDFFRWGFAKEMPIEVIRYGNPDNDAEAGDLKGHNQVYLRGEAYIGWGILVQSAFSGIVTA